MLIQQPLISPTNPDHSTSQPFADFMNISYQMPLISNFCICGRYLLHADKLKSGQADKLNNSQEVLELNQINLFLRSIVLYKPLKDPPLKQWKTMTKFIAGNTEL